MRQLWLGLVLSVLGCSSSSNSGFQEAGGSSGSGGVGFGQSGCTPGACTQCGGCWDTCKCATGAADDQCHAACGENATGGAGGATGGAGGATGGAGGATGGSTSAGGAGGTAPAGGPAAGIRITKISVYQTTAVAVMNNGGDVTNRNAPIVADKPAILRVFYSLDPEWVGREVVCRLEISGAAPQEIRRNVFAASEEKTISTTFAFDVPREQLTTGAEYSVSLLEGTSGSFAGSTGASRWPVSGQVALGAQSAGGNLKLRLVPITIGGRAPDTSQARIDAYYRDFYQLYPVPDVEVDVRAGVTYSGNVTGASGSSWNGLLNFLLNLRDDDNPARDVYYYGMIAPGTSAQSFCASGCIAGLSPQAQSNDVSSRGSVGLGYWPSGFQLDPGETAVHEVGHAHGLPHAPCQVPDAPAGYPYSGGKIGAWGWDLLGKVLKDPNVYTDMMGYCQTNWISDFNYKKIFTRTTYVKSTAFELSTDPSGARPEGGVLKAISIDAQGVATWIGDARRRVLFGEQRTVVLSDASGAETGAVTGYWYPNAEGGLLLVRPEELAAHRGSFLTPRGLSTTPLRVE